MKNENIKLFLLLVLIFAICTSSEAAPPKQNHTEAGDHRIDRLIDQLNSSVLQDRESAAKSLLNPVDVTNERVAKALAAELSRLYFPEKQEINKKEQSKNDDGGEPGDEEEYAYWLMMTIASYRIDAAFPLMVKSRYADALIRYGDRGSEIISDQVRSEPTCVKKEHFIKVLSDALGKNDFGYIAQGSARENIEKLFLQTLMNSKHPDKNTEYFYYRAQECARVRLQIVIGLGHLAEAGDSTVTPVLQSIAQNDPYYQITKKLEDVDESKRKYEVREKAQRVLLDLKGKEQIK